MTMNREKQKQMTLRTISFPPIKEEYHNALQELPYFARLTTKQLVDEANCTPGGEKCQIPDRVTAIAIIMGPSRITDPRWQVQR